MDDGGQGIVISAQEVNVGVMQSFKSQVGRVIYRVQLQSSYDRESGMYEIQELIVDRLS